MVKEQIKLYEYSTSRNKFKDNGKAAPTLKKGLLKINGNICYICGKEFSKKRLQLEHKIPVIIGGHLFDDKNIELCCVSCHNTKSILDRKIIKLMKDFKIIWGKYIIYSFYPINEVQKFYKYFLKIYKINSEKQNKYHLGKNGVDYIQEFQELNREQIKIKTNLR